MKDLIMEEQTVDAFKTVNTYTMDDIYALPDGERAELIDGKIYYMAPPNTKHQTLVMELSYQIKDYIKRNDGGCRVFPAPFAVFLNKDDKNYVEPDISMICDEKKITDKGCYSAPDWTIEIVSPSSRPMDYFTKLFKYRTAGVREYWIHPELQSKWNKAFWARGYYVETIGNITDEAVQKYIKEQAEESRKENYSSTAL